MGRHKEPEGIKIVCLHDGTSLCIQDDKTILAYDGYDWVPSKYRVKSSMTIREFADGLLGTGRWIEGRRPSYAALAKEAQVKQYSCPCGCKVQLVFAMCRHGNDTWYQTMKLQSKV